MRFKEVTKDNGIARTAFASNNNAEYILTSAFARDLYAEFLRKHDRQPSSSWFNRNFNFKRI